MFGKCIHTREPVITNGTRNVSIISEGVIPTAFCSFPFVVRALNGRSILSAHFLVYNTVSLIAGPVLCPLSVITRFSPSPCPRPTWGGNFQGQGRALLFLLPKCLFWKHFTNICLFKKLRIVVPAPIPLF